jgi:hypothetical protein
MDTEEKPWCKVNFFYDEAPVQCRIRHAAICNRIDITIFSVHINMYRNSGVERRAFSKTIDRAGTLLKSPSPRFDRVRARS